MTQRRYYVRNAGTVNCTVTIYIAPAEVRRLLRAFNLTQLKFSTFELLSRGRGWYQAVGDDWHVDSALLVLQHLEFATNYTPDEDRRSLHTLVMQQVVVPLAWAKIRQRKRYVVPVHLGRDLYGRVRRLACNRALQAALVRASLPAKIRAQELEQVRQARLRELQALLEVASRPKTAVQVAFEKCVQQQTK